MPKMREAPLAVVIPPPIWALLFAVLAWALHWSLGMMPVGLLEHSFLGILLIATGVACAAWGRLAFARAGAEIRPASPVNSLVVTEGPFRFTRNPMYLGLTVILLGIAFIVGTLPFFVAALVFFVWVNLISIPFEEQKMERQHGKAWHAYAGKVRRWI